MELGFVPERLVVHLTRGTGFRQELESITAWDPATVITLAFSPPADPEIQWLAEIDGTIARWEMPADAVDAVLDAGADSVMLLYAEPGIDPDPWAKGYVSVH